MDMSKILTTEQLRSIFDNQATRMLGGIDWEKRHVFFQPDDKKRFLATYVYSDGSMYHIIDVDKGVYDERTTTDIDEVVYIVLNTIVQNSSHASSRRLRFAKQLEMWSKADHKFYLRRKQEIEEILKEYPYKD